MKVECDCGLTVSELILERHIKTKRHVQLIANKYRKINKYNEYKDIVNCCSICLKTHIDDEFFIKDKKICICCEELSRGGVKSCKDCKELVNVSRFERPYLIRCRDCANKRLSQLTKCPICGLMIKLSASSYHKQRNHTNSECEPNLWI